MRLRILVAEHDGAGIVALGQIFLQEPGGDRRNAGEEYQHVEKSAHGCIVPYRTSHSTVAPISFYPCVGYSGTTHQRAGRRQEAVEEKTFSLVHLRRPLIVVLLLGAGFLVHVSGLLDAGQVLAWARSYTGSWFLVLALIGLQVVLYVFALPGSFVLWIVAPLYPPLVAAIILAVGGTLGGVGAYYFSERVSESWIRRVQSSRAYRVLHAHDHFFTIFAMRILPGFPHSVINYSSGLLECPVSHFIPATFLGMAIKYYLYASVLHGATTAGSPGELLVLPVFGPLIGLFVVALAAIVAKHRLAARNT